MTQNLRQILFATVPLGLFGFHSVNLALKNQPDWFAALGALIVAWAVVNLAWHRDQYLKSQSLLTENRLISHLNLTRELDEIREESLNLTFDLHASQIAQIRHEAGRPNPFVEENEEAIRDFCQSVENRLHTSKVRERSSQLIESLQKLEQDYASNSTRLSGWSILMFRLEIFLVVWGTLQAGYGSQFVHAIHDGTFSGLLGDVWRMLGATPIL